MQIFAANWKLNKNPKQTAEFFLDLKKKMQVDVNKKLIVFPPATSLETAARECPVDFGSQNCFWQKSGAFTGEISAEVVQQLGGKWVLLGHSERRTFFAETDQDIANKLELVQSLGLNPMLCIGETLAQRESNKTESVLYTQLEKGLAKAQKGKSLVIAYEPVWAIGTGKIASMEQIAHAHGFIAKTLQEMNFEGSCILYGGSVKPDNSESLLSIKHVNGFLIGGAGLEVDSFLRCSGQLHNFS